MQKFRLIFKGLCQSENEWHDLNYIYCIEVDSQSLTTQMTSRVSTSQLSASKKSNTLSGIGPNSLELSLTMDRWTLIAVLLCGIISYSYEQAGKKRVYFLNQIFLTLQSLNLQSVMILISLFAFWSLVFYALYNTYIILTYDA